MTSLATINSQKLQVINAKMTLLRKATSIPPKPKYTIKSTHYTCKRCLIIRLQQISQTTRNNICCFAHWHFGYHFKHQWTRNSAIPFVEGERKKEREGERHTWRLPTSWDVFGWHVLDVRHADDKVLPKCRHVDQTPFGFLFGHILHRKPNGQCHVCCGPGKYLEK